MVQKNTARTRRRLKIALRVWENELEKYKNEAPPGVHVPHEKSMMVDACFLTRNDERIWFEKGSVRATDQHEHDPLCGILSRCNAHNEQRMLVQVRDSQFAARTALAACERD
jgi:hypothetical protein